MTQRGDVRTVPGNQSQSTKAFRVLATQGTIGSPARRDAVEFSSDFQQGEVVAGLPGRTIQDDTSLLGTPQPGDARDLIISGWAGPAILSRASKAERKAAPNH